MTRARFVLLVAFLLGILISCTKPQPTHHETLPQTPSELAWDTKLGRDYIGRRLVLNLAPKSYTCAPGIGILWFNGSGPKAPPTLALLCAPPLNNTRALRVVGSVRSIDYDDIDRGGGTRFTITMTVDGIEVR